MLKQTNISKSFALKLIGLSYCFLIQNKCLLVGDNANSGQSDINELNQFGIILKKVIKN